MAEKAFAKRGDKCHPNSMTRHTAIDCPCALDLLVMTNPLTTPVDEIETGHESPPAAPRWVKAFGIALVILLVAFLALHLTGHAPMAGMHGG